MLGNRGFSLLRSADMGGTAKSFLTLWAKRDS
jgi:hypothetical protein